MVFSESHAVTDKSTGSIAFTEYKGCRKYLSTTQKIIGQIGVTYRIALSHLIPPEMASAAISNVAISVS